MLNINGTEYPTMEEIWKISGLSEEEIDAIKLKNDIVEKLINRNFTDYSVNPFS
jgi:hypothetical protein